ncbi:MAG: DUF4389 domain-containing protein [Candidatus Endonucleobacter sp. (ex Gigantidas childressi)]|nr:DUF4389 domain-containing protein [Candidatus Endonucleobacter sp. (ex Gigantidas childressi)]
MMNKQVISNFKSESRWLRLFFMVVFFMAAYMAALIISLVVVVQVVYGFIKGEPNERLRHLSKGLNSYFYQVLQYIGYNSDTKPYPFSDWPSDKENSKKPTLKEK